MEALLARSRGLTKGSSDPFFDRRKIFLPKAKIFFTKAFYMPTRCNTPSRTFDGRKLIHRTLLSNVTCAVWKESTFRHVLLSNVSLRACKHACGMCSPCVRPGVPCLFPFVCLASLIRDCLPCKATKHRTRFIFCFVIDFHARKHPWRER
jgi:hypothetical protein